VTGSPLRSQTAGRRRVELAADAGMVGAVLFVAVFTVQGWLYPGYSWAAMFVSELSLGPYGLVQILNFMLTGALMIMFGRGLRIHFGAGAASRAGPLLVQFMGVSLMLSGPFTTDPSTTIGQISTLGTVHGIFGAVFFTLAPVSCFVFYRRFRVDALWRPLAGSTLAAGMVLSLGIALLRFSQQRDSGLFEWKGLVQRVLLVTFMAWIYAFASRLRLNTRSGKRGTPTQSR
jgi:hypothetical protein